MRWVIDNIQLIFIVAGAIAYWLVQTRRQKEVLDYVTEFVEQNGYSPSYDEIAGGMKLRPSDSPSARRRK